MSTAQPIITKYLRCEKTHPILMYFIITKPIRRTDACRLGVPRQGAYMFSKLIFRFNSSA